jgi:hypothetical protein
MRERRKRSERRQTAGRRSADYQGRASLLTFVPALCGALVVLYLFFVAISGAELAEEPGWPPRGGGCSPGARRPSATASAAASRQRRLHRQVLSLACRP